MSTTHPKPVPAPHRHAAAARKSERTPALAPALARGPALLALLAAMATCVATAAPAAAQIYRTVDADGNVVFTDVPPRPGETAEKVELSGGSTFTPPPDPEPTESRLRWSSTDTDEQVTADTMATVYETVEVVSPGNDETVRENSGNITIAVRVVPELRPGHRVQLELDGQPLQTSQTPTFQLQHVDRGTHQVQVHVLDQAGAVIRSSDPSTFHLLRYSKLTAPNRPVVGPRG
jgi:hypothetical protein